MENTLPVIDVDAYQPTPIRNITIDGASYPVLSPFDLPYSQYTEFRSAAERLEAMADDEAKMAFLRDLISALTPGLPQNVLQTFSINRLVWLFGQIAKPSDEPTPADS